KVHRLNLQGLLMAKRSAPKDKPSPQRRTKLSRTRLKPAVAPQVFTPPKPAPFAVPAGPLVQLVDLDQDGCRWPSGDPLSPGFGYCGAHRLNGQPYCPAHAAAAVPIGSPAPSRRAWRD